MGLTAWILLGVILWGTPLVLLAWVHRKRLSITLIGEVLFCILVWVGGIYGVVAVYRFSLDIASQLTPSPWRYLILMLLLSPVACIIRFLFLASRECAESEIKKYQRNLLEHADARLLDASRYSIWSTPDFDRISIEQYDDVLKRLVTLGASRERPVLPGFTTDELELARRSGDVNDDRRREQSHAPEPAPGPASDGES